MEKKEKKMIMKRKKCNLYKRKKKEKYIQIKLN